MVVEGSTEAGNSLGSGWKRLATPRLSEDLQYRSWKNALLIKKIVCGGD